MNVIRPNDPDRTAPKQPNAVAGLDVLRVFAAMAVVVLHASVPYLRIRMPGLVWPVGDNSSRWVDAVFWGIEVMIMPLFLVIAGFLLWRSSRRLSPGQLVSSRAKRILIPLAFGILVILPIDLYIWTVGLVADGAVEPIKLKSLKFDTSRDFS
jgi:glucan biosynthesis protein C